MRAGGYLACISAAVMLCACDVEIHSENIETENSTFERKAESTEMPQEPTPVHSPEKELLECKYFNGRDFDRFEMNCEEYETGGEIVCGTVPHHLLAGRLISGFFRAAAKSREHTDTVIIVGTMHEPHGYALCTTERGWSTPFGKAENDEELSGLFREKLGAVTDDEMMTADHSVSAMIPFAEYYFPDSECACLLVSGSFSEKVPEKLAELIGEYSEKKRCLTVFSADFSHYLEPQDTASKDSETFDAVMNSDISAISRMTNENVDSARCLETFVRLADRCSRKVMLDHSDSLIMSAQPYSLEVHGEGLTSYFVFAGVNE